MCPPSQQKSRKALVDGVPKCLAGFEFWNLGCFNFDRFASLRIATGASCSVAHFEGSKSDQGHALLFLERGFNRRQCSF